MSTQPFNRRRFLGQSMAAAVTGASLAGCGSGEKPAAQSRRAGRLFFTSQGRTAVINADGSGLRYFDFKEPNQVTWQPGPFLSDGKRVIFLSMEARRDGPGRPFDKFYHQTPTHLWLHDPDAGTLTEICTRDQTPSLPVPVS